MRGSGASATQQEIEKALAGARNSSRSDGGITERLVGGILYWLQEKSSMVYVVATANDVDKLPPELIRKGRFDEMWFVDLPDADTRRDIFHIHLKQVGRDPKKFARGMKDLVELSVDFTGAEIENCIKEAMYAGFFEDREFTAVDIGRAVRNTVPLYRIKQEEMEAMRNWGLNNARMASSLSPVKRPPAGTGKKRRIMLQGQGSKANN